LVSSTFQWDDWLLTLTVGSGSKLRETVRAVICGTVSLLSQSIEERELALQKQLSDSISPPVRPDSIPRNSINTGSSHPQPTNYNDSITSPYESSSAIPARYAPIAGSLQNQHTAYPQSTQYHTYPNIPATAPQPSYSPHHDQTFISNIKAEEASDLVRFARQANQAAQGPPYGHNDFPQRDVPTPYAGPEAWNDYTAEAVENFGMGEPFAVNALIQLGASDLGSNGIGVMHQDMRAPPSATLDHEHFGGDISSISSWPQAVFDMSHQT
jgi:hypothetical protein